jgi:hypothetical protein
LGEGDAALGAQSRRPIQHIRNPPLLGQRRKADFNLRNVRWARS